MGKGQPLQAILVPSEIRKLTSVKNKVETDGCTKQDSKYLSN